MAPTSNMCLPGTFISPSATNTGDITFAAGTTVTASFVGNVSGGGKDSTIPSDATFSLGLFCGAPVIATDTLVASAPFAPSASLAFSSSTSQGPGCSYTTVTWTWNIPQTFNVTGEGCFLTLDLNKAKTISTTGTTTDSATTSQSSSLGTSYSGPFAISNTTTTSTDTSAASAASSGARKHTRGLSKGAIMLVGLTVMLSGVGGMV